MAWTQRLGQLRSPVSTYANLPLTGNVLGDVRLTTDTGDAYTWMIEASSGLITDWKKVTTSSYNDLEGAPESTGLDIDNAVLTVTGLAINIAYLGFQTLTSYLAATARMVDGAINRFVDASAIETSENAVLINDNAAHPSDGHYMPDKGDLDISTRLLLHGDGIQGSQSFADLMRNGFVINGAITDTTTKKFGTGSIKFDGINDSLEFEEGVDFGGYDNFWEGFLSKFSAGYGQPGGCIDFWLNAATGVQPIISNGAYDDPVVADGECFSIAKNASNKIVVTILFSGDPNISDVLTSVSSITPNTWTHIAIQRTADGYTQIWINGVLDVTSETPYTSNYIVLTWPCYAVYIGKEGSTYLNGYIDELRCSDTQRYETTFTPMTKAYNTATEPAPTPEIVDESDSEHEVTVNGNARMSGTNPLFGNASLYLDGIDSYLSLADSDDWQLCEDLGAGEIDSYTKLLLHLDNNVVDSETTPKTVTNNNVTFSSSIKKFGTHSGSFNGSNSYLELLDSSDWALGNLWTVDMWVNFSAIDSYNVLISQGNPSQDESWSIRHIANGTFYFEGTDGSNWCTMSGTTIPTINTWYHIAVVSNTSSIYLFVNGVLEATQSALSIYDASGTLQIGASKDNNMIRHFLNGYLDEVRISKGVARWTSNFTPPTVSYGESSFSDYTVDLWIDPLSLSDANAFIIGQDDAWKLTLDGTSNKYLKFSIIGGSSVIAPIDLSLETWQHVAVVQSSGTIKIYVDGILGGSIAGEAIEDGTEALTIGADSNGEHLFDGFIEEVRISDNARWTSTFSTPDEPYESDENTKLLLPLNVQVVPNMVLQSVGYVSNYVPTSARVVIFEEDIDVMEQNVDLKIEVSRDGGTTFTTCLIAKDQEFGDGTLNLFSGSVDLQGQPNGELLVWKLTTQNNKDCRIRGVSLSWR